MSELSTILEMFKGKSVDEIADMVKRRNIKGRMGTTSRCPMALLLDGAYTGHFIIGRKYIVRRRGDAIDKARTPLNVAQFVRKFDIGGYPELIAPPPRCVAPTAKRARKDKRAGDRHVVHKRAPIQNHLAKLVNRFSTA